MTCEVVEVLRRSQQGITQPYICRASSGDLYFVKGRGAGYSSLVKEWISAHLARRFGLALPDFAILHVSQEFQNQADGSWLFDLGSGLVFGSKALDAANEISMLNVSVMDDDLKRDIVAFDLWIKNGDRTLSDQGGNPNILWDARRERPYIIDHNLAFDEAVALPSLHSDHIFGAMLIELMNSRCLQVSFEKRFQRCLEDWNRILLELPDRWSFADDSRSVPTGFDLTKALAVLRRFEIEDMWK